MSIKNDIFPVIAIGASAGGLEAMKEFFGALPEDFNAAYLVLQHFDPEKESILDRLISSIVNIPVVRASDGDTVNPGMIMIMPSDRDISFINGKLKTSGLNCSIEKFHTIDCFFNSLSEEYGEACAGIVLSGMGRDGAAGLEKIRSRGGIALVQEPDTAACRDMPENVLQNGVYDRCLPPGGMPVFLNEYFSDINSTQQTRDDEKIRTLLDIVYDRTGHDFSSYKINTIRRRVNRQAAINRIQDLDSYIEAVKENPPLLDKLFRDFLIGVTGFFRDIEAFNELEKIAVPALLIRAERASMPVRIWIPACSTGEEAYSVAILFFRQMRLMKKDIPVQIFATDIDHQAVDTARRASYPQASVACLPAHILKEYFEYRSDRFRPVKEIRDSVIFSTHSLIKDPPFSRVDLISCRNLMIYLDASIQKRLLSIFHYALNHEGFLFLGSAETIAGTEDMFTELDKKYRIYKRVDTHSTTSFINRCRPGKSYRRMEGQSAAADNSGVHHVSALERVLLERFCPAAVIINRCGDIVYIHGTVSKYLDLPSGEAKLNLYPLLDDTAASLVSAAVSEITGLSAPRVIEHERTDRPGIMKFTVMPLNGHEQFLLIVFEEGGVIGAVGVTGSGGRTSSPEITQPDNPGLNAGGLPLALELEETRKYVERISRDLDASNAELKSANEELLASNEELQSTNEELYTSQEELQSMNEELMSLNSELNLKNRELIKANSDLDNLFKASKIPILFLDENLCILRFTAQVKTIFNLIETDAGRPLTHISDNFEGYPVLFKDISRVLNDGRDVEREVRVRDGSVFWMRIIPYRTELSGYTGIVISFSEITELKKTVENVRRSERRYSELYHQMMDGSAAVDIEGRIISANMQFLKMLGYSIDELRSLTYYQLTPESWHPAEKRIIDEQVVRRGYSDLYEKEYIRKDGTVFPVEIRTYVMRDESGKMNGYWAVVRDITRRVENERALKESEEKFRLLAESSSFSIMIYQDNKWVYVNPRAIEISGYTAAEIYSMDIWELVHPDYQEAVKLSGIARQRGESAPSKYEFKIRRKDGSFIWVILTGDTILYNGRHAGLVSVIDINDRKTAEQSLAKERAILNSIIDRNPYAISIFSPAGDQVRYNSRYTAMFGGDPPADYNIFRDTGFIESGMLPLYQKAAAGETVFFPEFWYNSRSRSGKVPEKKICLRSVAFPVNREDAELEGIVVIHEDVSDRKIAEQALRESEERLREIIDHAIDGIIIGNRNGGLFNVNERSCELTGYSRYELIQLNIRDLFSSADAEAQPIDLDFQKEGRTILRERNLLRADGTEIPVEMNTRVMPNGSFQCFLRDVRDKKKIEAEREKAHKLESLGILAGGIAHDFNNILATILGNVTLAKFKSVGNTDLFSLLTDAEKGGYRARDLTQQLLTFSRGGAPVKKNARIEELIKDSAEFILRGSSTTLSFSFNENLFSVNVDAGQISQVIQNLIINANQSMPGGGRIEINVVNIPVENDDPRGLAPGPYVKIDVKDEGVGIPLEMQKSVFDPYFTTKQSGSGLGLSICYSIVKRHDGHIELESETGKGSTFSVYLPAVESVPEAKEGESEKVVFDTPLKILFMDDDRSLQRVALRMLKSFGHQADVASDGVEAMRMYAESMKQGSRYDIVIMDLTIPGGMGGMDLMSELIILDPDVKAIVSSGYSNDPVMAEYTEYGFKGMIAKPFDVNQFMKTIKEAAG
jgi:two-component system CheB/CheR fusion protein